MSESLEPPVPTESGEFAEPAVIVPVLSYAGGPNEAELRFRRQKRTCLVVALCGSTVGALLCGLVPLHESGLNILVGLFLSFCALTWVAMDSQQRGRRVSTGLRVTTFLLIPVGLVLYYLSFRDYAGLGRAILFMIGVLAVMFFVEFVIGLIRAFL